MADDLTVPCTDGLLSPTDNLLGSIWRLHTSHFYEAAKHGHALQL